jgi:hypothetical protein
MNQTEANRRRIEALAAELDRRVPRARNSGTILVADPPRGYAELTPIFAAGWVYTNDGQFLVVT